eukprot:5608008-Amphidinium_carterae.1
MFCTAIWSALVRGWPLSTLDYWGWVADVLDDQSLLAWFTEIRHCPLHAKHTVLPPDFRCSACYTANAEMESVLKGSHVDVRAP